VAIIPIGVSYASLFTYHKDAHKIPKNSFGNDQRIGVLIGTIGANAGLEKFGKFEESYSNESLFKKLKVGRVNFVIDLYLPGKEVIGRLFPNEIDHFNVDIIPESAAPIAILLDANYPNGAMIGKRYQEGMNRILKNGVHRKIIEKYFGKNHIPSTYYTDLSKFEFLYSSDLGGNSL